ncbi:thioesterase II family protein [Hymenobacter actinosclerus]|nr:alpha/beta fold hydrolase [Hymenobacter actinosclerus]
MKKIQLFSIPYAGGGRYSYQGIKRFMPANIEHVALELPGRGQRVTEDLLVDLDRMVDDLAQQLQVQRNGAPFVLYGHSMGGVLGHQLLRHLARVGAELPMHFLISGCAAPCQERYQKNRHRLSDGLLTQELMKLGGLPPEVLASEELMSFCLPIIRADIQALELHAYRPATPYSVPLTIVSGTAEGLAESDLDEWSRETMEPIGKLRLPGNHFFIEQQFHVLAGLIQQVVTAAQPALS